jgi:hypothetical protein
MYIHYAGGTLAFRGSSALITRHIEKGRRVELDMSRFERMTFLTEVKAFLAEEPEGGGA